MPLRTGKAIVGVVAESTAYTYATPAAGDCFPAYDITVTPEGEYFDNPETSTTFGKAAGTAGAASCEIAFKVLLRGQGGTGLTLPHMDDAFLAAGLGRGMVGGTATPTDYDYKPVSLFDASTSTAATPVVHPSAAYSCSAWIDGVKHSAKGGVADLTLTWTLGQGIEAAFSFKGAYEARVDEANPTPTGVATTVPPSFINASAFQLHTYGAVVETFSISLGNVLTALRDAKDANGILGYIIGDRRITGSITIEDTLIATKDWFSIWRAGTEGNLTTGALGDAFNRITFTASRVQFEAPSPGDRDKLATLEIPFRLNIAAGGADGSDFDLRFD